MASYVPKVSKEPSFIEMYRGCIMYVYYNKYGARHDVMMNPDDETINYGNREATDLGTKTKLEEKYKLEYVLKI